MPIARGVGRVDVEHDKILSWCRTRSILSSVYGRPKVKTVDKPGNSRASKSTEKYYYVNKTVFHLQ